MFSLGSGVGVEVGLGVDVGVRVCVGVAVVVGVSVPVRLGGISEAVSVWVGRDWKIKDGANGVDGEPGKR